MLAEMTLGPFEFLMLLAGLAALAGGVLLFGLARRGKDDQPPR